MSCFYELYFQLVGETMSLTLRVPVVVDRFPFGSADPIDWAYRNERIVGFVFMFEADGCQVGWWFDVIPSFSSAKLLR
jgi:hypothetical protein